MTRSALTVLLTILVALGPAVARAQDAPEPAQGVCLPLEAHQAILADLRELRGTEDAPGGLRQRVTLLDEKLTLRTDQLRDMTLAKDRAVQAKEAIEGSLAAAVRGKREAEESRDAWHRSRVLWLAVGVVGALAIAIAVDKIQE